MSWRIAESLLKLREQVNEYAPTRRKVSDGGIGDAAHAARTSDHNPWVKDGVIGIVTAIDITHDPVNGCDVGKLADGLVDSKDKRIKYIIYDRQMASSYPAHGYAAWEWRPYAGSNPHVKHMHISVAPDKMQYDDRTPWDIDL